ncbi:MAG: L-aspartate oxidase [Candidatus Kapabacteria bacterium]|nr:L-aspartate oxidase [Candidatus Kapabacteria bacterium]
MGGGIAGLSFSLKASSYSEIILLSKEELKNSNTMLAQGGVSAVWHNSDSIQKHINDTLTAGDGLCNLETVELVVNKAYDSINDLIHYGVEFTKDKSGEIELAKEGGHSNHRVVHVKDHTGRSIVQVLENKVKSNDKIKILEHHYAVDLIVDGRKCLGASVLNLETNEFINIFADYVVLACGGLGQLYKFNTNPEIATGDGIAMAARAGAEIGDMEFLQFHPTMLFTPNGNSFLISEAVRGFGAELKLKNGESFMKKYHPMGSLAPRDIVARAMFNEMQENKTDCVYLDLTQLDQEDFKHHFPSIYNKCKEINLDITIEYLPVVPSAHFICGGIKTDLYGETNINNLFAIGENACTGLHGANRLASNSLLEGLVFADQASIKIKDKLNTETNEKHKYDLSNELKVEKINISVTREMVQEIMWDNVGIIRNDSNLLIALETLLSWEKELNNVIKISINRDVLEIYNLVQCGVLVTQAAINRNENRGGHYKVKLIK